MRDCDRLYHSEQRGRYFRVVRSNGGWRVFVANRWGDPLFPLCGGRAVGMTYIEHMMDKFWNAVRVDSP